MKTLAVFAVGFVCGLFATDVINPNFTKMLSKWISTPLVGGFDPLALALIALVLTGIHFARAKYKGGK